MNATLWTKDIINVNNLFAPWCISWVQWTWLQCEKWFSYNNENYCHKSCMTVMRWKPHSFQTNCFWYVNAKKTYLLQTQDTVSSSLPFVSLLGPLHYQDELVQFSGKISTVNPSKRTRNNEVPSYSYLQSYYNGITQLGLCFIHVTDPLMNVQLTNYRTRRVSITWKIIQGNKILNNLGISLQN